MPVNELLREIFRIFEELGEYKLQDSNSEVEFPAIILSDIVTEPVEDKTKEGYIVTLTDSTGSEYEGKKETAEMLNYVYRVQNILDEQAPDIGDFKLDFIKIITLMEIKKEEIGEGETIMSGTAVYSYYLTKK